MFAAEVQQMMRGALDDARAACEQVELALEVDQLRTDPRMQLGEPHGEIVAAMSPANLAELREQGAGGSGPKDGGSGLRHGHGWDVLALFKGS